MATMTPDQAANLYSHFEETANTMEEVMYLVHLIGVHGELGDYFYGDRHITREVYVDVQLQPELAQAS